MLLCARPAVALPLAIGIPKSFDTTFLDPRLLAYGLYASQTLKLNDGVKIRPWRMGSGGDLYMGVGTVVYANIFAVGYAGWGPSSVIQGDLRLGGTFGTKIQDGAWIHGAVIPDSTLTPLRLTFPAQTVVVNRSVVVESGDSLFFGFATDYPRDITVRAGGKLTLRGGNFTFRNLVLNPTAKLYLQGYGTPGSTSKTEIAGVTIDVHGEFLVDRAVVVGESWLRTNPMQAPDGRSVLWKYSGTQELHLNGSTRLLGTLVAPNAKVSLSSTAGFQGRLWAKDVEIHQYNGNVRFLPFAGDSRLPDTDGDGLEDTLEFRLGTDPLLLDTDGDGYTDGLEVLGRQNRMGAIKGVTQASPGFAHSWGWALDSTRRDLFNPLRRDQFLRVVWQDSTELRTLQNAIGPRWDESKGMCVDGQRLQRDTYWSQFAPAWTDSAYLDRFVDVFADPSDKPLVKNPHTARVPDYTVVMHLDAGPGASRNLEAGLPLFGGEVLVATGGTNTGRGPYAYDLNGDGRLSNKDTTLPEKACDGTFLTETDERTPLLERLFRGWSDDPFRDSWVLAIGFLGNGLGQVMDQAIASSHVFLPAQVSTMWGLRRLLLHEYGHAIGLHHPRSRDATGRVVKENGTALLADGLMNYAYGGGMFQRCHPVQGATVGDSRWCGPHPQRDPDSNQFRNWVRGDSDRFFNLTWWRNEYDPAKGLSWNDTTRVTDTVLSWEGGPVDPRTGFRPTRDRFGLSDLHYSRGVYCGLRLDSLVEAEGISRCRDPHGDSLPSRVLGTPIDWNQNGVIDVFPVDMWGDSGEVSIPWWMGFSATEPAVQFLNSPLQQDENDWLVWMKECMPFIGVSDVQNPFLVRINDRRQDLKRKVVW